MSQLPPPSILENSVEILSSTWFLQGTHAGLPSCPQQHELIIAAHTDIPSPPLLLSGVPPTTTTTCTSVLVSGLAFKGAQIRYQPKEGKWENMHACTHGHGPLDPAASILKKHFCHVSPHISFPFAILLKAVGISFSPLAATEVPKKDKLWDISHK